MADYTGTLITDAGLEWQADVDSGLLAPVFTRAVIGDTPLEDGVDPGSITQLPAPCRQSASLSVERRPGRVARVEAMFDNRDLQSGFYARWVGLYARGKDGGEVLVALSLAGERPDYFPTTDEGSLLEVTHSFLIVVSRAESVTVDGGDLSGFATKADLANLGVYYWRRDEVIPRRWLEGQIEQDERIDMLFSLLTNSIPGGTSFVSDSKDLHGLTILDGVWDKGQGIVWA